MKDGNYFPNSKLVTEGRLHFVMIVLNCLIANVNKLKKPIPL